MNRRSLLRNLAIAGAGSFFKPIATAAHREDPQDYILRSEVRLVLLDVSVKQRDGGLVSGLSKNNFQVFENGRLQPITVFDHDDLPVTLGILVDESRSMTPKRADVLTAAEALILESNRNDEMFVLNFNDTVTAGLPRHTPFSDDPGAVERDALARGIPEGRTALYDAVIAAACSNWNKASAPRRRWCSSATAATTPASTRRQMLDLVERSLATIFTIGLFNDEDADRDPGILKQLAHISGGEAFFPPSPSGDAAGVPSHRPRYPGALHAGLFAAGGPHPLATPH